MVRVELDVDDEQKSSVMTEPAIDFGPRNTGILQASNARSDTLGATGSILNPSPTGDTPELALSPPTNGRTPLYFRSIETVTLVTYERLSGVSAK